VDYGHLKELLHQPLWAYYVSVMLVMAPAVRIFARTGLRPWPALLLLVPYVGYMFCAAWLAFQKWPRLPLKGAKS
jgi:hypothetical protein